MNSQSKLCLKSGKPRYWEFAQLVHRVLTLKEMFQEKAVLIESKEARWMIFSIQVGTDFMFGKFFEGNYQGTPVAI